MEYPSRLSPTVMAYLITTVSEVPSSARPVISPTDTSTRQSVSSSLYRFPCTTSPRVVAVRPMTSFALGSALVRYTTSRRSALPRFSSVIAYANTSPGLTSSFPSLSNRRLTSLLARSTHVTSTSTRHGSPSRPVSGSSLPNMAKPRVWLTNSCALTARASPRNGFCTRVAKCNSREEPAGRDPRRTTRRWSSTRFPSRMILHSSPRHCASCAEPGTTVRALSCCSQACTPAASRLPRLCTTARQ
mmetsp:Transcript_36197/g.101996  ORF Transcript_36197/g.101996 Transcript_36197/m.101996 type:complete len:245 (-) Transcript_36197:1002-1736(-)